MNRTCTDARILKAANLQGVAGRSQMWSGFSRKVCPSAAAIEGNFSRLRARPAHFVGHLPAGINNQPSFVLE
jgi:hypothetical protein